MAESPFDPGVLAVSTHCCACGFGKDAMVVIPAENFVAWASTHVQPHVDLAQIELAPGLTVWAIPI